MGLITGRKGIQLFYGMLIYLDWIKKRTKKYLKSEIILYICDRIYVTKVTNYDDKIFFWHKNENDGMYDVYVLGNLLCAEERFEISRNLIFWILALLQVAGGLFFEDALHKYLR